MVVEDRLLDTGNQDDILGMFQRLPQESGPTHRRVRLQVCFFSATLHAPEIKALGDQVGIRRAPGM